MRSFFFTNKNTTSQSRVPVTQNKLPAFQLNQFRKRRGTSTRQAPRNTARRLRQRRGEGHSACCGQHARPPTLPHQGDEKLHVCGDLPSFGEREHPDHLDSFLAPSTACLDGEHDQFTSARRCKLGVRCLLVVPCLDQDCTVDGRPPEDVLPRCWSMRCARSRQPPAVPH